MDEKREFIDNLLRDHKGITSIVSDMRCEHPIVLDILYEFSQRNPALRESIPALVKAYDVITNCFAKDGTLYLCGNGGSYADSLHISGELLKSFERDRSLGLEDKAKFGGLPFGEDLAEKLEYGFRVVVLGQNPVLVSAYANDVDPDMIYAQHIWAMNPNEEDVLMAISTSGRAKNVRYAVSVAKAKNLTIISLTGPDGGDLARVADIPIKTPGISTAYIQETGLPVYHALCSMVEAHFFPEPR